ncbi:MAG: dihydroneopterin aldolase [Candidatus Zixiibacteriota bacterium]|nr:MAG: dihydroneopterin aldolase [candidate division Zixibacteria bacterium]HDL04277.1 dihydroneopterin aldolase [candidate division Zixibacteria bacterium]
MDVIRLNKMVFYGYHGVSAAEKETGRRYEIDCELETDLAPPSQTDSIKDTVDYVAVYQKIKEIVEGKAFSLIESLARALTEVILEEFPVFRVTLRVRKMIPPIPGNIDHIEIEVTRQQPDTSKILADTDSKE